jgi:hypothetical protein
MEFVRFLLMACLIAVFAAFSSTSFAQEESLPELITGLFSRSGMRPSMAPLKIAADAKTEMDFLNAQSAWKERVLAAPFRERVQKEPWADAARAFVQRGLREWPVIRTSPKYR